MVEHLVLNPTGTAQHLPHGYTFCEHPRGKEGFSILVFFVIQSPRVQMLKQQTRGSAFRKLVFGVLGT